MCHLEYWHKTVLGMLRVGARASSYVLGKLSDIELQPPPRHLKLLSGLFVQNYK